MRCKRAIGAARAQQRLHKDLKPKPHEHIPAPNRSGERDSGVLRFYIAFFRPRTVP